MSLDPEVALLAAAKISNETGRKVVIQNLKNSGLRLTSVLVPGIHKRRRIIHYIRDVKSLTMSQGATLKEDVLVDLSNPPSHVVEASKTLEFRDRITSRTECQSLVGIVLRNVDSFALMKEMLQENGRKIFLSSQHELKYHNI